MDMSPGTDTSPAAAAAAGDRAERCAGRLPPGESVCPGFLAGEATVVLSCCLALLLRLCLLRTPEAPAGLLSVFASAEAPSGTHEENSSVKLQVRTGSTSISARISSGMIKNTVWCDQQDSMV
jgi:hypothetical protein